MSDENSNNPQEEPQLFSVKKSEDGGWSFSRREFIKGAGATATALSMGGMLGGVAQAQDAEETPNPTPPPDGAQVHVTEVFSVVISADGTLLASGSYDNTIKLWSLPDGTLRHTLDGHASIVNSLVISADGMLLASGSSDNTIKLWSLPDGALLNTLEGHTNLVVSVAISADRTLLASGSYDNTIKLWSLPDGTLRHTLEGSASYVHSVAISADGTLLASAGSGQSSGSNGNIKLWSLPDGALLNTFGEPYSEVHLLAISADSTLLASGRSGGSTIELWSLPDGVMRGFMSDVSFFSVDIFSIAINPDNTLLASAGRSPGGSGGSIKLWSLADGTYLRDLIDIAVSEPEFEGAQYSPDDEGSSVITLSCGSPIPAGSTCICNCVTGSGCSCVGHRSGGGSHYWYPN